MDTEQLSGDILEVVGLAADSFNGCAAKKEALLRDVRSQIARVTELVSLVEEAAEDSRGVQETTGTKLSEILEGRGIRIEDNNGRPVCRLSGREQGDGAPRSRRSDGGHAGKGRQ